MTLIDQLPTVKLHPTPRPADSPAAELAEADDLIADLGALVDAGVVAIHRQRGGPLRYGAVADLGDAA
jgi:hypothetical protein